MKASLLLLVIAVSSVGIALVYGADPFIAVGQDATTQARTMYEVEIATGRVLRQVGLTMPATTRRILVGYATHGRYFSVGTDPAAGPTTLTFFNADDLSPALDALTLGNFHVITGVVSNDRSGTGYALAYETGSAEASLCSFDLISRFFRVIIKFPNQYNLRGVPAYDYNADIIYIIAFDGVTRFLMKFDLNNMTFAALPVKIEKNQYVDSLSLSNKGPFAGKLFATLETTASDKSRTTEFVWLDPVTGAVSAATRHLPFAPAPLQTIWSAEGVPYSFFVNNTNSVSYFAVSPVLTPPFNPPAAEFVFVRSFDGPLNVVPNSVRVAYTKA